MKSQQTFEHVLTQFSFGLQRSFTDLALGWLMILAAVLIQQCGAGKRLWTMLAPVLRREFPGVRLADVTEERGVASEHGAADLADVVLDPLVVGRNVVLQFTRLGVNSVTILAR